jgi:wobble nucleotide-excising tRNase
MLQKVVSILNVGRFRRTYPVGDVSFTKANLVFAENGRGKTTFCTILRSLATNTPGLVLGRRTLGVADAPYVQFRIDNNNVTFQNGAWSRQLPEVAIFDATYIGENVFAGDIVDPDHRRNLYRVIIGATGVDLANEITRLDGAIRDKNTEIRDNRNLLQPHLAPGMSVESFIAIPVAGNIDEQIVAAEQEVQAAKQANDIRARGELSTISVPTFPASVPEALAKTLPNVSADVARRIEEHIQRHMMGDRAEGWLSTGLEYRSEDACPFCGQALNDKTLINSMTGYFSEEYGRLRDEVLALDSQVARSLSDVVAAQIEQQFIQNDAHVDWWKRYATFASPVRPRGADIEQAIIGLRRSAQELLRLKSAAPLDVVAPGQELTRALEAFDNMRAALATYNEQVAAANVTIQATKRSAAVANVQTSERKLATLKAQKVRHTPEVIVICLRDAQLQRDKEQLDVEKTRYREQLETNTNQVITRYGQSINRYLERINAGFRISAITHNYRGGTPITSYQIIINNQGVDLGDGSTPIDQPSFKNTLSAGDRTTLALSFFLAQLEQDLTRANRIVVFDDPFSSLDGFRRNHTVFQIFKCVEACAQVIVFSHEPAFLKLLWDLLLPADRRTVQLKRIGEDNTAIAEWDIEHALQNRHRADIEMLNQFASANAGAANDVIMRLRPVLEGYCKTLNPALFLENDTLGVIVGKIRGTPGHLLEAQADDIDEINIYSRKYHHDANNPPGALAEPLVEDELRGYVQRTLRLVGGIP